MAFGYSREERAELDAQARAILEACPDVGSFIRRGLAGDLTARPSFIFERPSIPRLSSPAQENF